MRWSIAIGIVAALGVAASGCSGAEWQQMKVAPAYRAPRTLKVALVSESRGETSSEAVQVMQEALVEGLASRGIVATFVAAPADGAITNLTVASWDEGVRALRWLWPGAGEGWIVVLVKSPSADGRLGLDGTARGWVRSGWFGGSSLNAASEAGRLIAEAIATGRTED
jgi:hypothetical protein